MFDSDDDLEFDVRYALSQCPKALRGGRNEELGIVAKRIVAHLKRARWIIRKAPPPPIARTKGDSGGG